MTSAKLAGFGISLYFSTLGTSLSLFTFGTPLPLTADVIYRWSLSDHDHDDHHLERRRYLRHPFPLKAVSSLSLSLCRLAFVARSVVKLPLSLPLSLSILRRFPHESTHADNEYRYSC